MIKCTGSNFRSTLIGFGSFFLLACGGGNSSSSPIIVTPPPPTNAAPNAVITASSTIVEERQSFTLSAANSSDPEGDTISYSWSQTRGTTIVITDPSAEVLNLVMPESNEDVLLTFKLDVSDGTNTNSTSIDITLDDIRIFPTDTKFTKRDNSGLVSVENPLSFLNLVFTDPQTLKQSLRGFIGTSRRDTGEAILSGWRVLGPSASNPQWEAPNFSVELSGITIGMNEKPNFTEFTLSTGIVASSFINHTEWFGVFFDQSDKILLEQKVFAAPSQSNVANLPNACSADVVQNASDRIGAFITYGDTAGGLWRLPVNPATTPVDPVAPGDTLAFGTPVKIEATGNYCNFVQDLDGNVLTIDNTARTIDVRTFGGTKMSVPLDMNGSNNLQIVNYQLQRGTEYLSRFGLSYLFVLLSDGQNDGDSRLHIYELADTGIVRFLSPMNSSEAYPKRWLSHSP